jgi:chloride channel protein, CIC family
VELQNPGGGARRRRSGKQFPRTSAEPAGPIKAINPFMRQRRMRPWQRLRAGALRSMARAAGLLVRIVRPNVAAFLRERQPLVWGTSVLVGVIAAFASIGFRLAINVAQLPWLGTTSERVASAAADVPWPVLLVAPAIGGLLVGWVLHFVPNRRGGGPADVIEAELLDPHRMSLRRSLIGALASAITLGSGGSAGREGPVVHLGGAVASWLARRLRMPQAGGRVLLGAGVASAIAASFNAPIAGALFAMEVVLRRVSAEALPPIVIASSIGAITGQMAFGAYPAFILPAPSIASYWEFPAFALLGLVAAAAAALFQLAVISADWVFGRIALPPSLKPALGGLAVGSIGVFFPEVFGVGYETVEVALQGGLDLGLLLALAVLKTLATAITLGSRLAGGIFSPSLYVGAVVGGAFGLVAGLAFPEYASDSTVYTMLGMGAVAGAVLGAPISTTVMVFELTGGYAMSVALLLTVSLATALARASIGPSYFHWQLAARGVFPGPDRDSPARINRARRPPR